VYCLFIYFFLEIVVGIEIVINVVIWVSSLALSSCADIFEGVLWQYSLQDVMMGALNNPCQFIAVCSCQIVFVSEQKYVTILTVACVTPTLVFDFPVFLYRLSGELPRFSWLLIQLLPECLKLFIPAATVFVVYRPPLTCYLTPTDQ
jgi:hypothetical protein